MADGGLRVPTRCALTRRVEKASSSTADKKNAWAKPIRLAWSSAAGTSSLSITRSKLCRSIRAGQSLKRLGAFLNRFAAFMTLANTLRVVGLSVLQEDEVSCVKKQLQSRQTLLPLDDRPPRHVSRGRLLELQDNGAKEMAGDVRSILLRSG